MNLHGKESRCVAFIPDQVKTHALNPETISFEKALTTTVVRVNDTLDLCHNAFSKKKIVTAVHLSEE